MTDSDTLYTGIPVAVLTAVLVGTALSAFGLELTRVNVVLAIGINLVVVGGAAPTIARWRRTPLWRWPVYGAAVGGALSFVVIGAGAF